MGGRALLLLLSLILTPAIAGAQPPETVRRVGYIANAPRTPLTDSWWDAFVSGLTEHGWVETRNIVIERRYADLDKEAARRVAAELVRLKVETIIVASTEAAFAARDVTHTVPIVMTIPADPVAVGLVTSLARPGGNVTGFSFVATELAGKQVELLKEAVPGLAAVAVLANPANPSHPPRIREIVAAARTLKLQVEVVEANAGEKVADAVRTMVTRSVGAAVVLNDPLFVREASRLIRLVAEQRLPVMYGVSEPVLAGGLISYGPSVRELFRRAADYVDRILKGAKPAELPIEQASTFELVINLKTARALGLSIPPSLRLRANRLVE